MTEHDKATVHPCHHDVGDEGVPALEDVVGVVKVVHCETGIGDCQSGEGAAEIPSHPVPAEAGEQLL